MTFEDPGIRMTHVREFLARENAKRRPVDHNGRPLPEPPPDADETDETAEPVRRLPAPFRGQGSSANGVPEFTPEEIGALAGQGRGHPAVLHFRGLMAADAHRREQQQRAAQERALTDAAARQHYGQRR